MAFLADGELAEQPLNRASPLDREHKRLDAVAGSAMRSGALVHGAHTGKALGA